MFAPLLFPVLLAPLLRDAPVLPSFRPADASFSEMMPEGLAKPQVLEVNHAAADYDLELIGIAREDLEGEWKDAARKADIPLVEYGKTPEGAYRALFTATVWALPGKSDGDVIILIDSAVEPRGDAEAKGTLWHIRDMFTVGKADAKATVQKHVQSIVDHLAYCWRKAREKSKA